MTTKKYKYRVLAGQHIDEEGNLHKQGEIFDTDVDCVARFNSPGSEKFQRVYKEDVEEEQARLKQEGKSRDGLEALSLGELKALAAEEEIDLSGATRKDDILKRIREHGQQVG